MKKSDTVYDYLKFHLGLYLATPAVLIFLAESIGFDEHNCFKATMALMISLYFFSGAKVCLFLSSFVYGDNGKDWSELAEEAGKRKVVHHWLYWIGLVLVALPMMWFWVESLF